MRAERVCRFRAIVGAAPLKQRSIFIQVRKQSGFRAIVGAAPLKHDAAERDAAQKEGFRAIVGAAPLKRSDPRGAEGTRRDVSAPLLARLH